MSRLVVELGELGDALAKAFPDRYQAALRMEPSGPVMPVPSEAECDVLNERARQRETWSASHDDEHGAIELLPAAVAIATSHHPNWESRCMYRPLWILKHSRKPYRERLVNSAALLIAEIERLDRAAMGELERAEPIDRPDYRPGSFPPFIPTDREGGPPWVLDLGVARIYAGGCLMARPEDGGKGVVKLLDVDPASAGHAGTAVAWAAVYHHGRLSQVVRNLRLDQSWSGGSMLRFEVDELRAPAGDLLGLARSPAARDVVSEAFGVGFDIDGNVAAVCTCPPGLTAHRKGCPVRINPPDDTGPIVTESADILFRIPYTHGQDTDQTVELLFGGTRQRFGVTYTRFNESFEPSGDVFVAVLGLVIQENPNYLDLFRRAGDGLGGGVLLQYAHGLLMNVYSGVIAVRADSATGVVELRYLRRRGGLELRELFESGGASIRVPL